MYCRYEILTSILDFMYQGEVSVTQEDLTPFLDLAEELQVKKESLRNNKKDISGKAFKPP